MPAQPLRPSSICSFIGFVGFVGAAVLLNACSERVTFESRPSGAKVYVGDMYVGETPTIYSTRDVTSRSYRVEKAGYPEAVGTLQARVAPGRIVGAIFTLGILAAARPMLYYDPPRSRWSSTEIPTARSCRWPRTRSCTT